MRTKRQVAAGVLGALLLLPVPVSAITTLQTFSFFTPGTITFPSPTPANRRVLARHQSFERRDLTRHQQVENRTLQRSQQLDRRGVTGPDRAALAQRQRLERQQLIQHQQAERAALRAHQANEASPFRPTPRPFG